MTGISGEHRDRLHAAGALVGVPIEVTDDAEWTLDEHGLHVGLGWYAVRGHGRDEAVALALLQLWEAVREERVAPDRARRRRTLVAARPEIGPLLLAITRLQAATELLTAMPGLRPQLTAAVHRSLPTELSEQPRHLQWVLLLLASGTGAAVDRWMRGAAEAVVDEWRAMHAHGTERPLRRVLWPDPDRAPIERFERALALLLPAYERLRALDAADRGLGAADREPEAQHHEGGASHDELGAAGGGDAEQPADGEDAKDGEAAGAGDDPPARAGNGPERAEGADLFASEQAGFVQRFLSTPLPAEGALVEALALPELEASQRSRDEARANAGRTAAGAAAAAAHADYRSRVTDLSEAIDRMRDVWAAIIADRVSSVQGFGRRPVAHGDLLSSESLAKAVSEARAGVAHPAAFLRRERRPRRRREQGSTDYVLLVDRSASMQGRIADAAADAALIMLEALAGADRDISAAERQYDLDLDLSVRTALVLFDADAHLVKPLSAGLDDAVRRGMHAAIRSPRGSTNDGAALREAALQLGVLRTRGGGSGGAADGIPRRRIAFVVSDGGSNDPRAAALELRRLRAAGVEVHGIGIGSDEVVRRYAPHSRRIDDPRALPDVIQALVEAEEA